jgi:hypothetical protein
MKHIELLLYNFKLPSRALGRLSGIESLSLGSFPGLSGVYRRKVDVPVRILADAPCTLSSVPFLDQILLVWDIRRFLDPL